MRTINKNQKYILHQFYQKDLISVDDYNKDRNQRMKILLCLCFALVCINAIPTQDIVRYGVPGYNYTWYSGYLQFNTGKYHYVFMQSQKDPDNDPITWWFNGGPGCSSLLGLFYQNGPFIFQPNSKQLTINKWSWNLESNVLYITTPGGVGFSESYRNLTYSDETATQDNLQALLKFYQKFPSLKKNQLYLTGQSYAGVYVPYLARAILNYNKLPSRQLTVPLIGFMVNNACTDPRECYIPRVAHSNSIFQYDYLYKHGFYTKRQYDDMAASCLLGYNSQQCANVRKRLDSKFQDTNTSIYNIYLPCYYQNLSSEFKLTQSGGRLKLQNGLSCQDELGMLLFLNQPKVHAILHVDSKKFENCNEMVSERYQKNPEQSLPLYKQLIKDKLRIWVTSGDHDADVPLTGTLTWIQTLREEASLPIQDPWRQWWIKGLHKHEDQVGGMTWGLRGLKFATIKGAGHMAHKDKRQQSWVMLNSFLKGTSLPYQEE